MNRGPSIALLSSLGVVSVSLMLVPTNARADVFNMPSGLTSLEMVTVGNPGNAPDTRYATPGYGSVNYTYQVGKYEVTAGQYTEFLNAVADADTYGLYNTNMADPAHPYFGSNIQRGGSSGSYNYSVASAYANRPVNYVSYWDACRFANWLHNNQPTGAQGAGTTETGAYTLTSDGMNNNTIVRNTNWKWAVTSEDEWYKAAYYKGGGTNAGYWDYATSSDTAPGQDMSDVSGNNANCYTAPYDYPIDSGKYMTLVGEFQDSDSPYGTFDQGGNVWEWNESVLYDSSRGLRGGSFNYYSNHLHASTRDYYYPTRESCDVGFRVAHVPEPGAAVLFALGGLVLCMWRCRLALAFRPRQIHLAR
jgi:sulfatase modifying factor 1